MENKRTFEEGISIFQRIERLAKIGSTVAGISLILSQLNNFNEEKNATYQVILIFLGLAASVVGVLSLLYTKQDRAINFLISSEIKKIPDSEDTFEELFQSGKIDADIIRNINNIYEIAQIYILAKESNSFIKKLCTAKALELTNGDLSRFEKIFEDINSSLGKRL